MKCKVLINKTLYSDNGKVIKIGDKISFNAYETYVEEYVPFKGIVKDITETSIILKDCYENNKKILSANVAYNLIEDNSIKFI